MKENAHENETVETITCGNTMCDDGKRQYGAGCVCGG